MDTGAALGGAGLLISIFGVIYSAINHKHIKTRCCGKVYEVSIDIGPNDSKDSGESKESMESKDSKESTESKEPKESKNTFVKQKFVLPKFDP